MDFPIRQPRVSVEVQGTLVTGGMRTPITMRNISLRGAMIDCEGWLMIDELVRIECPALPTLHAKIRWRRPPRYGLVFEQTFRIDDLARACAELQPAGPPSAAGGQPPAPLPGVNRVHSGRASRDCNHSRPSASLAGRPAFRQERRG